MKALVLPAASLAAVLALATSAHAITIFSDFGPGETYSDSGGVYIAGPDSYAGLATTAWAFASDGVYDVTQIDFALTNFDGTNSAIASLWTNVSGSTGVELGSWAVSDQPSGLGVTTITGITGVRLNSGSSYFLQLEAGAADTLDGWWDNTQGYVAQGAYHGVFDTVSRAGAFDVVGTAVPEPGAWTMLILGLFGAGALLRNRRREPAATA